MLVSKSETILECVQCGHCKDSDKCNVCIETTDTIEYVSNPDRAFIRELMENQDPCNNPFEKNIFVGNLVYKIESYGEDSTGVFLELYRDDRILKIYPKE